VQFIDDPIKQQIKWPVERIMREKGQAGAAEVGLGAVWLSLFVAFGFWLISHKST
jgi:hypothetical protein